MQEQFENLFLKLNSFYISKIFFDIDNLDKNNKELKVTPNISTTIHLHKAKIEIVKLNLALLIDNKPFLQVEAIGEFEIIGELTNEELKKHPLILYNSPAIIYPLLRSFIVTLTANLGYLSPIYLPIVNFYNLPRAEVIIEE